MKSISTRKGETSHAVLCVNKSNRKEVTSVMDEDKVKVIDIVLPAVGRAAILRAAARMILEATNGEANEAKEKEMMNALTEVAQVADQPIDLAGCMVIASVVKMYTRSVDKHLAGLIRNDQIAQA